jgi:hypothetical protein
MPTTLNTIARIEDRQTLETQEIINAYHFLLDGVVSSPDLDDLLDQFETVYINAIRTAQVNDVLHVEAYAKQINGGFEEATRVVNIQGVRAATPQQASFVAAGYRLNRSSTDVRNGSKRIAGVADEDLDGNVFNATGTGFWSVLNVVFVAPLVTTDGTWTPIIYSSSNPTPAVGPLLYSTVSGAIWNPLATSQVSRKA